MKFKIYKWIHYLENESGEFNFLGKIVYILFVFLVAFVLTKIITKIFNKNTISKHAKTEQSYKRFVTLGNLFAKVVKVVLYIIAFTIALDILGVKTSSLLATVGVGSLAISFGAQTLVKDVINGFFMMLENHYSVGDLIEVDKYKGVVEDIGIRNTCIRDFNGSLHIIPNGEIRIVTNEQRGLLRCKVEIPISIEEDAKKVINIIKEAVFPFNKDKRVGRGPEVWGVTANFVNYYEVTAVVYANPGHQFELEYEMREKIVEALNRENIDNIKTYAEVKNVSI